MSVERPLDPLPHTPAHPFLALSFAGISIDASRGILCRAGTTEIPCGRLADAPPPAPPIQIQLLQEGAGGARQEGASAAAGGAGVATAPARAWAMRGDGAAGLWMLRAGTPRGAYVACYVN